MNHRITVLAGDGIGPEITAQAVQVLHAVGERFGHRFETRDALIGGAAIDAANTPLPEATVAACKASDAVLLGAVGGPKWDAIDRAIRPEKGLLGLRKALGLFANLRPASLFPELKAASCLRPEVVDRGLDVMVVRELTGGAYFGEPRGFEERGGERVAFNTMVYSESEIRRIARVGFETARRRRGKLCSVDKANVLEVSQLWREVVAETAGEYPDVTLSHLYVDNAAMQLAVNPGQFDTIVTENLFGDILSDEASVLTGSIGLLPSASLGEGGPGLYEPVHGSAPDIAGQDKANPLAAILSVGMLLRHSLNLSAEADAVQAAVAGVLADGWRTGDILETGGRLVGCSEMGRLVLERIPHAP